MKGSKGNAAFNASEMPEGRDIVLNLNTANRMLPLVQRVVDDILISHKTILPNLNYPIMHFLVARKRQWRGLSIDKMANHAHLA